MNLFFIFLLNKMFNNSFLFFLPEFFFIFILLLLFLFSIFYKQNNLILLLNKFFILLYFFIFFLLINQNLNFDDIYIFNYLFIINNFVIYLKILLILFMIFFSISIEDYIKYDNILEYEIIILLNYSIFAGLLIISSYNFISFFISLELQSLIFYILTCYKKDNTFSLEAAIKYFVLGSLASCLLIFGISLIYYLTGMLSFFDFEKFFLFIFLAFERNNFYFLFFFFALFLIIISLFLKLGLAPFHMWLPDVYEGAPTFIILFFIIFPKIILFTFLLNFLKIFNFYIFNMHFFYLFIGIFSILVGTFSALLQFKIKRLLAYSTINHLGYMLIILSFQNFYSNIIFLIYIFIYLILNLNIFIILISLRYKLLYKLRLLKDFNNFFVSNYALLIILLISLFSLAGIPPLAGFFPKMFIILYLLKYKYYLILIFIIIMSTISSYYYINIINILNFKISKKVYFLQKISNNIYYLLSFFLFINFFCIFFYNDLFLFFQQLIYTK